MSRKVLTDEEIKRLKRRRDGRRYEVMDKDAPGLAIRVGREKTFIIICRLPDKEHPSRLAIGNVDDIGIEEARATAREWIGFIRKGLDPRIAVQQIKDSAELQRRQTFRSLLTDYMSTLPKRERNRHAHKDIGLFKRNLLNAEYNQFLEKPAAELTDMEVSKVIQAIRDRPARVEAIQCYKHLRMCFRWGRSAQRRQHYGLAVNPLADITLRDLDLHQRARSHYLKPHQIRAFLKAVEKLGYPFGSYCYMLALTVQRKMDVAGATWDEIDLEEGIWRIPAWRYKTNTEQVVPLSRQVRELLLDIKQSLPDQHGPFVFSFTNGVTKINCFSRAVKRLREQMAAEFLVEHPGVELPRWTLHDLRRTAKTGLAALQVDPHVSEAALGHGKKGIEKVYDQYRYLPQINAALQRWADYLAYLVHPDQNRPTRSTRPLKEPRPPMLLGDHRAPVSTDFNGGSL